MSSRKICIGHKDWKLSHAVCPISQTRFLICSILSCDCQGVENLTTKSREKYRTQLLPQGALPSCFCSCVNILTQAPLGVVMSQQVSAPGWRCPLDTSSAREGSSGVSETSHTCWRSMSTGAQGTALGSRAQQASLEADKWRYPNTSNESAEAKNC